MRTLLALALALAACSSPMMGGGDDTTPMPDAPMSNPASLGMNDVSILLPLPATKTTPTLLAMSETMIPRDLFTRLVTTPGDVGAPYEDFHLVAIRFDLCDRAAPGPCPAGEDGRLRLVFQPMFVESSGVDTQDAALHAFYPIPNAELADVIGELRELAGIAATPHDARLAVATALAKPGYADRLRALVMRYASAPKLLRLTVFAQNIMSAAFNWVFRGIERNGTGFADIVIPAVAQTQQRAILTGSDTTYDTTPVADSPAGFAVAIDSAKFAAASPAGKQQALEAMAAVLNPMTHSATTVQCLGCHVSTFLTTRRATVAGVNPTMIAGRYSSTYDLSVVGASIEFDRSLRAFGWFFAEPAISQRVVNDTAQTLAEIEARFPLR